MDELVADFIARQEAAGTLPPGAGVAVSVVENGEIVFSHTAGLRARDCFLPVTPHTRFDIASLTKGFTAAVVLAAAVRGLIDLERPINASKRLLALSDPDIESRISVADVLPHRTGLPGHDLLWYFGRVDKTSLLPTLEKLEAVPGAFKHAFIYSNLMYGALGSIFEELCGVGYAQFLVDEVLRPLGMHRTSFDISDEEDDVALPYSGTMRVGRVDMSCVAAAGGLKSTLHDMTAWVRHQLAERDTLALAHRPHISAEGVNPLFLNGLEWLAADLRYGFGWFIGTTDGMRIVFHPAFVDGFSHAVALVPERNLGVVVLTNVNLSSTPGLLLKELVAKTLRQPTSNVDVPELDERDRALIGTYENRVHGTVRVQIVRKRLVVEYGGEHWPLAWQGERTAVAEATAFGLKIPVHAEFASRNGVAQLKMGLSLDPRAALDVFTRTPE